MRNPIKHIINKGDKFGDWTVLKEAKHQTGRAFLCRNSTGIERVVLVKNLVSGASNGFFASGKRSGSYLHGKAHTREWLIWQNMRKRCDIPKAYAYKDYGGRGISYDPWWHSFECFWEDMKDGYSPELTLDRIDVNGNYSKENCRWATRTEQARNTRVNIKVRIAGKERSLFELAEETGIKYTTLYNRIFTYGIPAEEAVKHKYMRAGSRKAKDIFIGKLIGL